MQPHSVLQMLHFQEKERCISNTVCPPPWWHKNDIHYYTHAHFTGVVSEAAAQGGLAALHHAIAMACRGEGDSAEGPLVDFFGSRALRRVALSAATTVEDGHEAAVTATNVLWSTALKGQCQRCGAGVWAWWGTCALSATGGWVATRTRCWLRWSCAMHSQRASRPARSLLEWWRVTWKHGLQLGAHQ